MSDVCVIGLGSPHGDDQIGWELVRLLGTQTGGATSLRLRGCASVSGELLEFWKGAELAIIVDAVRGAGVPGTVRRISLHPQPHRAVLESVQAVSSHGIDLPELIELAHALGALPQRLVLLGVEIETCAPFQPLSATVRAALPRLARAVSAEIDRHARTTAVPRRVAQVL